MRLVIFGLTVSSAWGNGHATLWRSLIDGLSAANHRVTFFERDVPYYRAHRDVDHLADGAELVLYPGWDEVRVAAARALANADAAIVTSYCPDARAAAQLVLDASCVHAFYDLDTPVTFAQLDAGADVPYLPREGLGGFDLVLSFTGGRALELLRDRLGARAVAPLYGSVDPYVHRPARAAAAWTGACSYLGTWSEDRQAMLDALFFAAARRHPETAFVLAGSQYPDHITWPANVSRFDHVAPPSHPAFYCSCPVTLSVTRAPMAALGYCPSGRLFEAAACGVPVLSDAWDGLDEFFTPGEEILLATTTEEAIAALQRPRAELRRIGRAARDRALAEHTGEIRARELVGYLEGVA